jgi:type II secretory pathway pseudopilin PulG
VKLRRILKQDQGESLIELVVAILILGLAGVAITVGLATSAKVSDVHRKEANASAVLRDYAESIQATVAGGGYVSGAALYAAYTVPSAYSGYVVRNTVKQCWNDSLITPTWGSCASLDHGVQQLTLAAQTADQRAVEKLVIVVRKPCSTDVEANACP